MNVRRLKALALVGASGFLLQAVGCSGVISQLIVNEIITRVLVRVVDALFGNNDTTTA